LTVKSRIIAVIPKLKKIIASGAKIRNDLMQVIGVSRDEMEKI